MLDFAVAVGTGFTFSLLGHPLMASVQALPLVLIVFVGVPVTGALGLATLHRLLRDTDEELHDQAPVAPPR
jgi:ABC-type bacteriocin/lantibiotic exporter with double-glycine peptidase domain